MTTSPTTCWRAAERVGARARAWLGAALISLGSVAASAAAPGGLQCTLRAPARVNADQPVMLAFTVTNRSATPMRLLEWNTPFEGWFAPYVEVVRDGAAVTYRGPAMKRGDPSADEYVTLAAGGSRRAEVDLALAFDLSVPGRYLVTPHVTLFDQFAGSATETARPRDAHVSAALPCKPVRIDVVAAAARRP